MELCETRTPPPRLQFVWGELGYRLEQLPSAEDIYLVVVGAEVARRATVQRKNPGPPIPTAKLIEGMGITPQQATRALKLLESYGAAVEPLCAEVSF